LSGGSGCCGSPPTKIRTDDTASSSEIPYCARMLTMPGANPQSGTIVTPAALAFSSSPFC
jgi:hypothetical protein